MAKVIIQCDGYQDFTFEGKLKDLDVAFDNWCTEVGCGAGDQRIFTTKEILLVDAEDIRFPDLYVIDSDHHILGEGYIN